MNSQELMDLLEQLHDKYNRVDFIEHDPVSVPHRFTGQEDREISGFLAATIAWGNRKAIVKSAVRMMEYLDNSPYDFTVNASHAELSTLAGYVHRTFNGMDLTHFILALRRFYTLHGGLGGFFQQQWRATGDMRTVLSRFRAEFFAFDHPTRCEKHLSSIDKGAACKRLNMYLRWMVRRDDRGVDFGLWPDIPMSALYLPIDVHAGNMGRALGLLVRRQNDWKAVEEITASLREFDAGDPVRFDFSLFGAGIDGYLKES
ncbi:MAG: TIGR02757 family protein [Alistipes sp.]|nr:TIGR02757 family protein [Alistipes sp.]